ASSISLGETVGSDETNHTEQHDPCDEPGNPLCATGTPVITPPACPDCPSGGGEGRGPSAPPSDDDTIIHLCFCGWGDCGPSTFEQRGSVAVPFSFSVWCLSIAGYVIGGRLSHV